LKTKIQITKYLEKNYPQLNNIIKIESLKHNDINSKNFVIFTKEKKYLLKNFIDDYNPVRITKLSKILDFCKRKNVKIVSPILNKNKKFFDKENNFLLAKFYSGNFYTGSRFEIKDLAKNIAILHKTLKQNPFFFNYKINEKYYIPLTNSELNKIKTTINRKKTLNSFDKNVIQNLDFLYTKFSFNKKNSKIISELNLKKQLIHHDLHPGNVIFKRKKVISILDFNSIQLGYKMEDIAFASIRFATYKTTKINKIENLVKFFIESYKSFNKIKKSELLFFEYFFTNEILRRISYILRKSYFYESNIWNVDFDKHIKHLQLVSKIKPFYH